jgi:hypothetical protein
VTNGQRQGGDTYRRPIGLTIILMLIFDLEFPMEEWPKAHTSGTPPPLNIKFSVAGSTTVLNRFLTGAATQCQITKQRCHKMSGR